jgi:cysteine sulfinate desulfinase/cysteine desulfurase-like protein
LEGSFELGFCDIYQPKKVAVSSASSVLFPFGSPNTLNVTLPGYRGELVVLNMDRSSVQFSSGSACKSDSPKPSHALLAMNLSEEEAHCAIRFSLGHDTSEKDIEYTIDILKKMVSQSKNIVRFVPCR